MRNELYIIYRWRAFVNLYFILDDIKPTVHTNYSSSLNNQSQKLGYHNCRQLEYYSEALMVHVNTSGYYRFSSNNSLDTYAYLYEHHFDPYSHVDTSVSHSVENYCKDSTFEMIRFLQFNITYILVITTSYDHVNVQAPFSVTVEGPHRINMKRICMYIFSCNLSEKSFICQKTFYSKLSVTS